MICKSVLIDALVVIFIITVDMADCPSVVFGGLIGLLSNNMTYLIIMAGMILAVVISVIVLHRNDIGRILKNKHFYKEDYLIINLSIIALLLTVWSLFDQVHSYKTIMCVASLFLSVGYIVTRLATILRNKETQDETDVISLVDLYKGTVSKDSRIVLLEDSEIDEDVFGRGIVIDKVLNVMRAKNHSKSFTMSLVGPWGSGKSTILKCAKKKLLADKSEASKTIIIDNFEPWLYDDSETMTREFASQLFKKLGYRFNNFKIRDSANMFLSIASETKTLSFLKNLSVKESDNNPTDLVDDYLVNNDKKLIVIIDNLERCKTELIMDFLKMIKRSLNFSNTLYILSYDLEVMGEILDNNKINKKYLEKFSQMTITVPRIDNRKNEEATTRCFENYLKQIGEKPEDYSELIKHIVATIKTPRELLLAINSVYAGKNKYVNPIDSIILNILKRETPTLCSIIEQNEYRFVHNESIMRADIMNSAKDQEVIKKYCKEEREFFFNELKNKSLSDEVASHYELIRYLFPNISFFFSDGMDYDLCIRLNNKKETILKARKERRLRTSNFFSAYFTGVKNDYVEAADIVDAFIKNQTKGACVKLLSSLSEQKKIIQSYILQQINERMNELEDETINDLTNFIIVSFSIFSESAQPLFLSVRDELYILLSELIQKVDEVTFESIEKTLTSNYRNLGLIHSLDYWMKDGHGMKEERLKRYAVIKKDLEKMKNEIIQKRINMYEPKHYQRFTVRLLGGKEAITKYLQSIKAKTPKRRQILIVADFIYQGYSSNEEYFYEVDHSILDEVYSKNEILDIIKKANNSELKSVVKEIIDGEKDTLQGSSIDSKTYSCNENYDLSRMTMEYAKKLDAETKPKSLH